MAIFYNLSNPVFEKESTYTFIYNFETNTTFILFI